VRLGEVWLCLAVPEIVGGVSSVGTGGTTTAVGSEVAGLPEPPAFDAVSRTRRV
jgi:hypothetical protein